MSVHVTTLLWQLDLPMTEKLIALKLADNANEDGSGVRPKQATVAKQCGCSARTVQRVVHRLVGEGVLIEEPSPGNQANVYRFDMEAVRQRVRVTESQGDRESYCQVQNQDGATTELKESPPLCSPLCSPLPLNTPHPPYNPPLIPPERKKPLTPLKPDFDGAECPECLHDVALSWQSYRRSSKLKSWCRVTWESNFKKYESCPLKFKSIVENSISNGWQGLFESRTPPPSSAPPPSPRLPRLDKGDVA